MADSSPAHRRSMPFSSPQRSVLSDIISEDRNSEARHKLLLEAAKREHDRVREEAERVYRSHLEEEKRRLAEEERRHILEEKRKEEERIKREEQLAAERARLHALRSKKVEIPPPPPQEAPRPPAAPASTATPTASTDVAPASAASTAPKLPNLLNGAQKPSLFGPSPSATAAAAAAAKPATPTSIAPAQPPAGLAAKPPQAVRPPPSLLGGSAGGAQGQLANGAPQPAPKTSSQQPDRYTIIFRNLKALRKGMQDQAKRNSALKGRMGDMRREVKKSIGQLVGGAPGVNRQQSQKITSILKEALANQVGSQPIDASNFVLAPRQPVEGSLHNEPMMPSLFIYLLNIVAKAAIAQYINEAGPKPEAADPVGILVAATFSETEFLWRGESLIDILLAKFRVMCPVLFGYRGNEKMEGGREALGWRKENGRWVSEQTHIDRMQGLGAGFASIALRNFGKSKKKNPFPPRNYWTALAKIVNTPPAEVSNTQCVVLKAMIANFEQKFLEAYGNAAVAALRVALVDFPNRIPYKSSAVTSLTVQAQLMSRDYGLTLA
ncbi:GLE1-domain-containing protein [Thozetella sp. PMI_491]|nr:GLE1-domain-containing protein [Thozetella sp. PMI_491]